LPGEQILWVIDPLRWLPLALHRQVFPIPDVTTENGQRMMMVHVDGDGFAGQSNSPLGASSAAVLNHKIFDKYRIPTTVSIITGDVVPAFSNCRGWKLPAIPFHLHVIG